MGRGLDGYFLWYPCGCGVVLKGPGGGLSPFSGGYGVGETPLPIPNRAVKPHSADGTWLARARESRTPPVYLIETPLLWGWRFLVLRLLLAAGPVMAEPPVRPAGRPQGVV